MAVLTYVQSRRNSGHIQEMRLLVNGQTATLIETSKLLATAQGNREGRAESTLERAGAERIRLDDAKARLP
jgi:hypothetical protein